MGLFDRFFSSGNKEITFNTQEAFLGVIYATIAADGDIAEEEVRTASAILFKLKLFREYSDRQFSTSINKVYDVYKRQGVNALIDLSVKFLPKEFVLPAFTVSLDLIFSDGHVAMEERKLIERLQMALDISNDYAEKAIEVLAQKNMCN